MRTTVGTLVSVGKDVGIIIRVSPSNPTSGNTHWQRVGDTIRSYYVWTDCGVMGPVFGSELTVLK